MKSERLLEIIGMADDDMVARSAVRAGSSDSRGRRKYGRFLSPKTAIAASLLVVLGISLSRMAPVKAAVDSIGEWVQQLTSNYNRGGLDSYKIAVNQSQSVDGVRMTVNEVVLEDGGITAKCSFSHDGARGDDFVQTREWPFCAKVVQNGKVLAQTENSDNMITGAYQENDGGISVLYTVDLKDAADLSTLVGKETTLSFYYDRGSLVGKSYDFHFVPRKVYRDVSYDWEKTFSVDPYGSFTVETVTQRAFYTEIEIRESLKRHADEEFQFSLEDRSGNEYEQIRRTAGGEHFFVTPGAAGQELYLQLALIRFDENGVECDKTVLGKYPYGK